MTRMKGMLLMTALMMAAAQSSDPSELLDAIQGFDVITTNGSRNPLFVS